MHAVDSLPSSPTNMTACSSQEDASDHAANALHAFQQASQQAFGAAMAAAAAVQQQQHQQQLLLQHHHQQQQQQHQHQQQQQAASCGDSGSLHSRPLSSPFSSSGSSSLDGTEGGDAPRKLAVLGLPWDTRCAACARARAVRCWPGCVPPPPPRGIHLEQAPHSRP